MRTSSNVVIFSIFLATVNGFPGVPGYGNHPRPVPPIESGSKLSGYLPPDFPTYHMPIPTGVFQTGVFPTGTGGFGTGTGLGPSPTGSTPPASFPGTGSPLPPVTTSENSPTYTTSVPGGPSCPPVPEITVTETQTETSYVTVTVGGGEAPFPTGTAPTGTGTGHLYPLKSTPYAYY